MSEFISPTQQRRELILYIGDKIAQLQGPIPELWWKDIQEEIDARDNQVVCQLMEELSDERVITMLHSVKTYGSSKFFVVDLTSFGWEQYEKEKQNSA